MGNGHVVPIGKFDEIYIGVMGNVVGFDNHMFGFRVFVCHHHVGSL